MLPIYPHTRRNFLKQSLVAGGIAAMKFPAFTLAQQKEGVTAAPMTPQQFRQRLQGPIFSLPTPFTADYAVDHDAIRIMVQRALKHGVTIFSLTAGNSLFDLLSYDEIKEVNRTLVEAVGGRGISIAASDDWWTGQAVEFARYIDSIGAHSLQVRIPTRSGGEDSIVEHYRAIAEATNLPLVLHGNFSESLLKKLTGIPSIVAMKEDITLDYYIDRQVAFGERLAIFGGGAENRFLVAHPYGSRAFYSTYTTFAPDIAMQFWKHIQAGEQAKAVEHTLKYDYPFIKRFSHPFWHATLEHFGVGQRHMRPPMNTFTAEQMKEVKQFFDGQGIEPSRYTT